MVETPKQDIDINVDRQTFKEFDQKIQEKGISFVGQMDIAETKDKKGEIQEKAAAFMLNSRIVLELILADISDANKLATIDATNIKEPRLQTYIDAKQAFDTDMKALNVSDPKITKLLGDIQNLIDLKSIEANPEYVKNFDKKRTTELLGLATILPATQKILTERLTFLESKETDILNSLLNATPSREIADNLFEKNQTARNALLMKNRKQDDINKTQEQQNFEKLLKFYGGNKQEVESYEVKNYDTKNNPKYKYIQVKFKEIPAVEKDETTKQKAVEAAKERTEDIMFGSSTDVLHTARSEVYEGVRNDSATIEDNIKELDGNGSYREFEDILGGQKDPANFLSGLLGKGLLEEINKYESPSDKEPKINGYYGVILDYIVNTQNELLLNTYLNNVIVGDAINLKYLGTTPKDQIENFNKIVDKNTWNINKTSDNGKLLERIRAQLANVDKQTFQETLSKGLDSLIETFGPMLFSVLKMFGMGKRSLLKMFGKGYEKKINEIYKKEYELSEEQISSINNIVKSKTTKGLNFLETGFMEGVTERPETGEDMEKAFESKKKTYVDLMIDEGYYKNISVNVLKKGLDIHNKKYNTQTNINDIVTITTDTTTKKQAISEIKGDFRGVIKSILNNDTTRENIAKSNHEIKTETTDKKEIGTRMNEQGVAIGKETYKYLIQSEQDIARYLTASLFSDKDLGYVMTENKLNNDKTPPPPPPVETQVPTEALIFIDKDTYFTNEKLNAEGDKKTINEIIDVTKSPKKLQIIRGTTTINIEQATIGGVLTYVDENEKTTKIVIKTGDKIEKIPVERSIAEKRTEVKTELGKETTKTAKTKFEGGTYTLDNKNIYEKEVQKISNIFTEKGSYDSLISETSQITLGTMVKNNMSDIKNMFTFWGLKQRENKDEAYKIDKMTLDKDITNNIDVSKQTFTIKEAKDKTITIEVKKNPDEATNTAKEGSITIKNTDGKLTTERKETPAKA